MTETRDAPSTIDARVADIENCGLVEKCLQIALTRGREVRTPRPRKRESIVHWRIEQNLGASRLCYRDGRITIYVDQHVLGGESIKVYSGDPVHLVLDIDAAEFVRGYAPRLIGERKLRHYEPGDWIDHVEAISKAA